MKWQPIDTAPQNGDIFLLWEPDGNYVVGFYHFKRKAWVSLAGGDPNDELKPSHWMELPHPPPDDDDLDEVTRKEMGDTMAKLKKVGLI